MATAGHFFAYLRDAFDRLYEEGRAAPRMMTVGLRGRIAGRPGRAAGSARFLDYVLRAKGVWVCGRWTLPATGIATTPAASGA